MKTLIKRQLDKILFDQPHLYMKTHLKRYIQKIKENPLFIIAGLLLVVLSSLITVITAYSLMKSGYINTIGQKKVWLDKIELLTPEANIEYFKEIIGQPIFINRGKEFQEYIFLNKYSIIDAITDEDNKVIVLSVTTRRKDFNPSLRLGPFTTDTKETVVKLGKSTFSDLNFGFGEPKIMTSFGAHTYHYDEEYYLGNPGNYQSYIFSVNQVGDLDERAFVPETDIDFSITTNKELEKYREEAIINTYSVTSPFVSSESLQMDRFGPDYDQIRIIPNFFKE